MRPMIIAVPPEAPSTLAASALSLPFRVRLTWNDNSLNATGFTVERATDPAFTLNLTTFDAPKVAGIPQSFIDDTAISGTLYYYRVVANNVVGGILGVATEPSGIASSLPTNVVKFPTNLFYLTVVSPHGTVVANPSRASYTSGAVVQLTVTADPGWIFASWSGDATGSSNPISVTMSADKSVTAAFDPLLPTISGNAGVAGALVSYVGDTTGSVVADGFGNYSFTVPSNWHGTITPTKTGYTFVPPSLTYPLPGILGNLSGQNFTATGLIYTISGTVTLPDLLTPVAGVTLSYTDGTAKMINTNASGMYSFTVSYNWSGTVTAAKTGYTLSAPIAYVNVLANQTLQNYIATPIIHNISGTVAVGGVTPLAGVTLTYTDGTIKTVTTDGSGNYTIPILDNWSGPVVPFLPGYSFTPVLRLYPPVLADQTLQNFTATQLPITISGNVGVGGALITYSGGTTVADSAGNYTFPVLGPWTGTVTPTAAGFTFTPTNRTYTSQAVNLVGENYVPTAITYTISGNAGIPLAVLSYTDGTLKSVTADGSGNYFLNVSYGWAGTVTPSLTGFAFNPANRVYSNVLANVTGQNYSVYPGAFNKISPVNAASNQPTNPTLTWAPSATATFYQYCLSATLSTANCTAPASWKSTGTSTSVALTGLTPGTRYWQVRAVNANGNTYANGGSLTTTTGWFSFTILPVPTAFSKSTPSNGAINQPPSLVLSWAPSTNATVYTYCISLVASCTAPAAWISTGANTSAIVSGLTPNTRYYWQVIGGNATGSVNANGGTWWSFTIIQAPGTFSKTSPANGATNQPTNPTLSWGASARAASYSYCIDTVNNNACDASWISTGTTASAALTGLTPGTYYWQVSATNVVGTTLCQWECHCMVVVHHRSIADRFREDEPGQWFSQPAYQPNPEVGSEHRRGIYQYCIDTINNGTCDTSWISTGTGRTRALSGLLHGTTHYWAGESQEYDRLHVR